MFDKNPSSRSKTLRIINFRKNACIPRTMRIINA